MVCSFLKCCPYNDYLEIRYKNAGYVSLQSGYDSGFAKYFYGNEVDPVKGIKDDRFGFVSGFKINNDPLNADGTVIEQAVTFTTEPSAQPSSNGYVIYAYNPTNNPVNVTIRNTEWNWEIYDSYYTREVLAPKTWTKLEINSILLSSRLYRPPVFHSSPPQSSLKASL